MRGEIIINQEDKKCWECTKLDELAYCEIHSICPIWIGDDVIKNCKEYVEQIRE